jgi:short-subunit dehydrogenase
MTAAAGFPKRAMVTGASSGLGEEFARQLARRGYDLVLVARRRDRLEMLGASLAAVHGISAEVLSADLADEEEIGLVERRLSAGDIDLLVNNAGLGTVGEFAELPIEGEARQVDVNVRALLRLAHAALRAMVPRGSGAIINVASMAAYQPVPYNATYAATKAFVLSLSEALHEEAKAHGITVTCLCPGPVRTEFQQVAGIKATRMGGRPLLRYMAGESAVGVVTTALAALDAGEAVVIPGLVNQTIARTSGALPRSIVRRIAGAAFAGQARAKEEEHV